MKVRKKWKKCLTFVCGCDIIILAPEKGALIKKENQRKIKKLLTD